MRDTALEDAIDDVGRMRVFARAERHGWLNGTMPPKWVWFAIVQELRAERTANGANFLPGSAAEAKPENEWKENQ
jgi:hypothetical protein